MSKQLGAITTSHMGPTLNQQPGLSRDFHGTNAAEIFQGHELSRRSQPRHLYNNPNSKNLVSVQKIEEDSSDDHMTQDSNDTSDDAAGLNRESSSSSFLHNSMSNLKTDVSLTPRSTSDLLTPSSHEGVPSSSINPYSMSPDSHFFIPVHQLNSRLMSLPSNLLPSGMNNSTAQLNEEASRKRQLRLLKNKEAAKECRRKKKEYVKCLENRVAVLENQNKTLIDELKSLKELYCQKEVQS